MTVRAPARSAFMVIRRSSFSTLAETTTIGVGRSRMIRSVASNPFIPGRRMSIEMTSGAVRSRIRSASSPVSTAPTSSRRGSRAMIASRNCRITRESSMIRTRIRLAETPASDNLPDGSKQLLLVELPFHDVGVRAQRQTALAIFAPLERTDDDHGNPLERAVLLDRLHQAEAVQARHFDVGD